MAKMTLSITISSPFLLGWGSIYQHTIYSTLCPVKIWRELWVLKDTRRCGSVGIRKADVELTKDCTGDGIEDSMKVTAS
jgi:hypothetical protein